MDFLRGFTIGGGGLGLVCGIGGVLGLAPSSSFGESCSRAGAALASSGSGTGFIFGVMGFFFAGSGESVPGRDELAREDDDGVLAFTLGTEVDFGSVDGEHVCCVGGDICDCAGGEPSLDSCQTFNKQI